MIAADTSSIIAMTEGDDSIDTQLILQAMLEDRLKIAPVVLTELLSGPKMTSQHRFDFMQIPQLETTTYYWQRAGQLRSLVLQAGHKAKLGDTLIAQSCIDHDIPLITRDDDFRHFAEAGGLKLAC
jgi:hypothetical protein